LLNYLRLVLLCGAFLTLGATARAAETAPPEKVKEIIQLLDDPAVREWVRQRGAVPVVPESVSAMAHDEPQMMLSHSIGRIRQHSLMVLSAVPRLPQDLARALAPLREEVARYGVHLIFGLVVLFAALGYGLERLAWMASPKLRQWIGDQPRATALDRVRLLGARTAYGFGLVGVFLIGSVGAFVLIEWPPLTRAVVIGFLLAIVMIRAISIIGQVIFSRVTRWFKGGQAFRLLPISDADATFWYWRLMLFFGYFTIGWVIIGLLRFLNLPITSAMVCGYMLALGLLFIAVEIIWRRPVASDETGNKRFAKNILLSVYGVLLWALWSASLSRLFWLLVVAIGVPAAFRFGRAVIAHLLRPDEPVEAGAEAAAPASRGVLKVCLERALFASLIIGSLLWLSRVWQLDMLAMADQNTLSTRLLRGGFTAVVILLLADLLWQIIKAALDSRLMQGPADADPHNDVAVRQARLRTLLPIFRNIALVLIAAMAILTSLSALGVDIAPLIAGAGVFGVALGFGAQTLVKDVISGLFYLMDDAFRVGEYIQSGSYKGTVESFSLRSVRLRHHRGPVYTIPFGQLGAVQNMSRDWVIDKFDLTVTYDTDIDLARKLVRKIGAEMAEDPEFSRMILEPMKMQGVEQFGDYGIKIRCKITTRPGEEATIRRKAYLRIRDAFSQNGIKFASPTVTVSDEARPAAAAAKMLTDGISAAAAAGAKV
jgi:moderate conductance mechanosensitive channel